MKKFFNSHFSSFKSHLSTSRGFTLIELLVVITILGILVTLTLVTINPAEAQKKARDTGRLKDMATLQSIVEQYLSDNPGAVTLADKNSTNSDTGASANSCSGGWLKQALGASVCAYANVIPVDPVNRVTTVTTNAGAPLTSPSPGAVYFIRWLSGTSSYKICTYLESTSNKTKLTGDGEATVNNVFAIFSSDAVACP